MIEKSSKMPSQSCACKGIRTCLICEESKRQQQQLSAYTLVEYVYCWRCGDKAYLASSFEAHLESHKLKTINDNSDQQLEPSSTVIPIDGVYLQEEALTPEEELKLAGSIDSFDWVDSQSGRRKQDFGPKINFKKKKINFAPFAGLPQLDVSLLEQIKSHRLRDDANWSKFEGSMANTALEDDHSKGILRNFKTVEICHLEYCPERGSSIDPHFDDFWIWGERLVTLNLLSSAVITLTLKSDNQDGTATATGRYCIRVHLPPRSLLVLYGDARYRYEHSIRRSDITSRRLAVTFRELPASFLDASSDDYNRFGKVFIEKAQVCIESPQ